MKRVHAFEFGDMPWFPSPIHQYITDYLNFIQTRSRRQLMPFVEPLTRLLERSSVPRVVDLCSGGAGPWTVLAHMLNKGRDRPITVTLTDLSPNLPALAYVRQQSRGVIDFEPEPVDATRVPESLAGVRTIFNGFHHLRPEQARAVLADAARSRQPIAVFELVTRKAPYMAMGAMLTPLVCWAATPFIRPFRAGRLFWTYAVPVMPLITIWDGLASALRIYSEAELAELLRGIPSPGYRWEIGSLYLKPVQVPYLLGYPDDDASSSD